VLFGLSKQLSHVVRQSGDSKQTGLLVEQAFHFLQGEALL
jgi:hypothetical protein